MISTGDGEDPYFNKFKRDYVNIGVGGLIQYDTRNDVATPSSGMLLSAIAKVYGKYLGGAYNYEMFELEYRQFQQVFRPRSTLAMDRQDTNRCGERSFYGASFIWFPFRSSRILLGEVP